MGNRSVSALTAAILGALLASGVLTPAARAQAPATQAPAPPAGPAPTVLGVWRSGGSTLRITVQGSEGRGTFLEVGDEARALGFKPQDVSFVAQVTGSFLAGYQTTRYRGTCYANGRKVPMMGRMTPDGQFLAIHFYDLLVDVDANCRDTGAYNILQSLWERVPGAP